MRSLKWVPIAVAMVAGAGQAGAGVTDSANVTIGSGSYRTFIDQTTGLTWLDLDNFWDTTSSYNTVTALVAGSGFHLATSADLATLQASIPAIPANYAAEAVIVGGNYIGNPAPGDDRDLIWGIFEDGNSADAVSYSFKFGGSGSWSTSNNVIGASDTFFSHNGSDRDLGAWVVSNTILAVAAAAPEPATLAIFGLALAGLGISRRRR